jgi:hypothetical protein
MVSATVPYGPYSRFPREEQLFFLRSNTSVMLKRPIVVRSKHTTSQKM